MQKQLNSLTHNFKDLAAQFDQEKKRNRVKREKDKRGKQALKKNLQNIINQQKDDYSNLEKNYYQLSDNISNLKKENNQQKEKITNLEKELEDKNKRIDKMELQMAVVNEVLFQQRHGCRGHPCPH